MKDLFKSSADPSKVSLTIKGAGVALIPIAIGVATIFGIPLLETDLVQLVEQVATIVSALMILVGLVRKVYLGLKKE